MRNVSYFPPYSQAENVATNTVLLLFSHVHRLAPGIFADLLTRITDDEYAVGPTFHNQVRMQGGSGIPDALIQQAPFEIYVETKLGGELGVDQIEAHLATIKKNETVPGSSILIGLTGTAIAQTRYNELRNLGEMKKVRFFATTFSEIADILEKASADFRTDLNLILEEYRAFIQEQGLVPVSENKLLINPCGTSYEQNKRHHIYHDQPGRSKVFCKYLGIYKEKSVSLIGKVLAVVNARIEDNKVVITENHPLSWRRGELHEPTEEEQGRILGIVNGSDYYNLRHEEARYYIVDRFVKTEFIKTSKYGIFGHRYFNLDSSAENEQGAVPELFENQDPSLETLAAALNGKTWV